MQPDPTPASRQEFSSPEADARGAAIEATLGTEAENLVDTVWLLQYTTVRRNIQWPTDATARAAKEEV